MSFLKGLCETLFWVLGIFFLWAWFDNLAFTVGWDSRWQYLHSFDWIATLDYTTVTTLIPWVGFFGLAVGMRRIKSSHQARAKPYFPMFDRHTEIAIGVGLIGTVIGLILGFSKGAAVTVNDLQHCMGTALFSTLSGLIWAYVIAPIFCPLLRSWYDAPLQSAQPKEGLVDLLGQLSTTVSGLCTSMQGLQTNDGLVGLLKTMREALASHRDLVSDLREELAAERNQRVALQQETVRFRERERHMQTVLTNGSGGGHHEQ